MPSSIYLINPRENAPGYYGAEFLRAWGVPGQTLLADLSTPTVAAFVPDGWDVRLCDERIEPVNFDTPQAIVGITGKVSQRDRMIALAAEFRRRGKTVMIGGPYASLNPDDMRPHADILIRGEIEEIAAGLFADIEAGSWKPEYEGTRPDLRTSPLPRWDLYGGPRKAISAQVQTSRGCPFECEFCDVIQYLGRKQRWKEPDQVVAELDVLYAMGYRTVFLADDNFTIMRRRARALLERLAEWNRSRPSGPVAFSTQVSIDIARDPELLDMCRKAGIKGVFIGVETPNEESLSETMKRQNLRIDLAEEVSKVVAAGMLVTCGMIVGFDHDDRSIFERQAAFIDSLPTPMVGPGLLVAPAATPLHARIEREGRLIGHDRLGAGSILYTNIEPKLMSLDELRTGMRWLLNQVFAPSAYARRIEAFAATCEQRVRARPGPPSPFQRLIARGLASYGPEERALVARVQAVAARRPDLVGQITRAVTFYCQVRYMLVEHGVWDQSLVGRPPFADMRGAGVAQAAMAVH